MKVARLLIAFGFIGGLALAGCQARQQATSTGPSPQAIADSLARIASIQRGHETFVSYCAMCHGDGGNGDGEAAPAIFKTAGVKVARLNDRDVIGRLNEKKVREVIAKGGAHTGRSNLMPAWGEKLAPDKIDDLVKFVVSLADSNPAIPLATLDHFLESPPGVPSEGRVLFLHHCSPCHGAYGKGDGAFGEQLWKAHQIRPRNLTDSTYLAAKTDRQLFATVSLGGGHFRKSAFMPAWAVTMTPAQIKSVVAYVREISGTAARP
jgi:mono/diheme cytochrome c family protein